MYMYVHADVHVDVNVGLSVYALFKCVSTSVDKAREGEKTFRHWESFGGIGLR